MLSNLIIFLIALIVLNFAASTWLDILNMRCVRAHSSEVPEAFRGFMDFSTYEKSVKYTLENTRFGIIKDAFNSAFLALILLCCALPFLFEVFGEFLGSSIWAQSFALVLISLILSVFSIPFELYDQFVIEEKFGFNKGNFKLWMGDKIKEILLSVILMTPLVALLIWFYGELPNTWWLWGFGAIALFQILMMIIYPRFIMPLFNKLSPLEDGELKDRLFAVADRGGFAARTILVMDGSKRSSHSNAFFTGFGRFRKIVLFDTLIEQLTIPELEAVLAHEIGHYKKGHIIKMIASALFMMFAVFAAMAFIAKSAWFYEGLGFSQDVGFGAVLMTVTLYSGLFSFWLSPISNAFSRKYEYEADAFARELCGAEALSLALRKLNKKNLSNLTPHKLFSAFHYSHPTLLEREEALFENSKSS